MKKIVEIDENWVKFVKNRQTSIKNHKNEKQDENLPKI